MSGLPHLPSRILAVIKGWREHSMLQQELDDFRHRGELDRLMADCGLGSSDLPRLTQSRPLTPRLMDEMLARLGIDRTALSRTAAVAEALRAMEWQCAECEDWRKCRAWLARGDREARDQADNPPTFCPNAKAFEELRQSEMSARSPS